MNSDELAYDVQRAVAAVQHRILTVGADNYEHTASTQQFEHMPMHALFDMALEELEDLIAYAVMLRIRVNRLKEKVWRNM